MKKTIVVFILFLLFMNLNVHAQNASAGFDMTGFPQWTRDLRRAEIVAFGSFPFTYFFSAFAMDTYRFATNDWDRRYAFKPLKPAGAIDFTPDEQRRVLAYAIGSAVVIAIVDHLIVRYQRSKQEQQILSLGPGTPIILTRPIDAEDLPPEITDDQAESFEYEPDF